MRDVRLRHKRKVLTLFTVLKLIGAYLISIIVFLVVPFYHAYKAGSKGSLYRTIMSVIFVAVCLLVGLIAVILMNSTK